MSTIVAACLACTASAAQLVAPASAGCPKGAAFLVSIDDVRGACSVAFDGGAILVCAPEQVDGESERQIVRAIAVPGKTDAPRIEALESGAQAAVDLAIGPDRTVAVADAGGAVLLIAPDGSRREMGRGMVARPNGIAWRGERLLVSDARAQVVIEFDRNGAEVARFGKGLLGEPCGLAVSSDGTFVVADRRLHCLWSFDAGGGARRIGSRGANPGQFQSPRDVAIRERGGERCIFVADELNHRVQILEGDGSFVGFFGMHALVPRQGSGRIHYPVSVALDPTGEVLAIAEAFEDRVQVFRLGTDAEEIDPAATSPDFISSHFGAESACSDDLLALVDVETQGVALLDARKTPPIHISIVGGVGATPGRFVDVSAIGLEPGRGRLWVADAARARVDVYDTEWDRTKPTNVDMFIPRLARSADLSALVTRAEPEMRSVLARIPIATDIAFPPSVSSSSPSSSSPSTSSPSSSSPSTSSDAPSASLDDASPTVLLLDEANLAVIASNRMLSRVTGVWRLPADARMPVELAVAADGTLAIADPIARAVFLRTTSGEWNTLYEIGGNALRRPVGVEFDREGRLVVSDAAADSCIASDADGRMRTVGERGVLDEQFYDPQSVVHSPLGLIVVDRGNHRFQRFGDGFTWNLTGSMGRYYDRKRRGSPGAPPPFAVPGGASGAGAAKGGA